MKKPPIQKPAAKLPLTAAPWPQTPEEEAQASYVDPILFETGFFKDRAEYERLTAQAIRAIREGQVPLNRRALRPATERDRQLYEQQTGQPAPPLSETYRG